MNYTFHIKSFLQNIIDHIMIMKKSCFSHVQILEWLYFENEIEILF